MHHVLVKAFRITKPGRAAMAFDETQHVGDGQLIYGLPKNMVGISKTDFEKQSERSVGSTESQKSFQVAGASCVYWTVHPEPDACAACRAMEGIRFAEKPKRPHPNCRCTIEEHVEEVRIMGILQGQRDHALEEFFGDQTITVTVQNLGPLFRRCGSAGG